MRGRKTRRNRAGGIIFIPDSILLIYSGQKKCKFRVLLFLKTITLLIQYLVPQKKGLCKIFLIPPEKIRAMIAISQKTVPSVFGLLLALALHAGVIALLLSDKISVAFVPVTRLITTRIIYEPNLSPQPLRLREKPLLTSPQIEPPDIPGIQVAPLVQIIDTPLVKIGARFEPGFDPEIPIKEVPTARLQLNTERIVGLSIQIYEDGGVGEVLVEHGSDSAELNRFIARYAKQHWRFMAATQDGTPVASWKSIDVVFSSRVVTVIPR